MDKEKRKMITEEKIEIFGFSLCCFQVMSYECVLDPVS